MIKLTFCYENSVKEIRFLPSAEATTMYGTNNMGGVIEIKSK